ncbi:MAG: ABC transporter ATP-binding protein [Bombilactobacillus mellis]|uniref:ABC transporter ATP-binding protein n=1 Tax=Bombilactobacillus mellis TaxID=1218508 RepID=UPI001580D41B|nr:ABC transporter ATP-binding protein [Bombilactobacillus mellis]MBI0106906.1 ABC transporter ATP-binding protein [Lactobacillus sp. W8086]MBI0108370.1 ABC transporter ATP-binding protein [Lactobacillus sp. W8085]MBI0111588.1 ABC transporter ATP-binding protein [Lactobacillus sp. W8088]MBI0115303.1 ABC transporter ATP-binding protein [Lactobacillus sp. W8087]MBI0119028.1 ABC transporter ATP-binding protein [Lactobacillus sp. W8089]MBI0130993.1 ABC transporter ATP-binding protein [Lactobacill
MSLVTAQNIVRVYGHGSSQFQALRGVSLDIQKGESVAIVGKSGSGKSTLMHILALLDHPTSGTITLNDQPVQSIKTKALNQIRNQMFGFVFQQFFLNARDSVLENVMLPLRIGGITGSKRRYLAEAAIEAVGLSDKKNNHAQDLSGGQKQRVCIARALVNNPEIIFADEPTGNLDSTTGAKIENILFDLQQKQDITLIMVTHDQDLAAKCQRQIQIKDGQIVSEKGAHQ